MNKLIERTPLDGTVTSLAIGSGRAVLASVALGSSTEASGAGSVAVGIESVASGNSGIAIGEKATSGNGDSNISIGEQSGSSGSTGNWNVAAGSKALHSLTTGEHNIGLGTQTLYRLTKGVKNIAIGQGALFALVDNGETIASATGSLVGGTRSNVAIGAEALGAVKGRANVAIGERALHGKLGSSVPDSYESNTAIGYSAMLGQNGITGSSNTAVGSEAGKEIITGEKNTCVGAFSRLGKAASNNVAVGYRAGLGPYTGVRSRDTHDGSRNVWIGSDADGQTGDDNVVIGYNAGNETSTNNRPQNNAAPHVHTIAIGSEARTTGDNEIQMGKNSETFTKFGVGNGTVAITASSRRWKHGIAPLALGEAQQQFDAIEAQTFTYGENAPGGREGQRQAGFIAEDADAAGMFVERTDGDVYDISERNLVAVLWAVVKDQQRRIEALESA